VTLGSPEVGAEESRRGLVQRRDLDDPEASERRERIGATCPQRLGLVDVANPGRDTLVEQEICDLATRVLGGRATDDLVVVDMLAAQVRPDLIPRPRTRVFRWIHVHGGRSEADRVEAVDPQAHAHRTR